MLTILEGMLKANENSVNHGFWEEERNFGEQITLMHSELSECFEYYRKGNKQSDHIPEFSGIEEEFADVLIRIFDTCQHYGYRLEEAIIAKMKFNATREFKHGKKC